MKISDIIIDFIKLKENDCIFWIQWTPNLPLFVSAYEKWIKVVNNSSENHSIYSSIWKYNDENRIQFVFVTMWPWILWWLKALGNCYTNNIPLVLITPYNSTLSDHFWEHHASWKDIDEIDTHKLLDTFTCFNVTLKNEDNILWLLNKAYDYAEFYKKPVNISIPYNLLNNDINIISDINDHFSEIKDNKILLLWDTTTKDEIQEFANKWFLYFIIWNSIKSHLVTDNYLWTIPYDNNIFLSFLINKEIIKDILVYKVKWSYYNLWFLLSYNKKVNIYHLSENELDKCYYFLWKNIKYYFNKDSISDFIQWITNNKFIKLINTVKERFIEKESKAIYYKIAESINKNIDNSNVHVSVWWFDSFGKRFFKNSSNNYYFASSYLDMWQVMKSIWYSIWNKQRNNICITWDWNLLMNLWELNTIDNLDLNITFILINNSWYKSLWESYKLYNNWELYKNEKPFNEYENKVDYKSIAKSFNFNYLYIKDDIDDLFNDTNLLEGKSIIEIDLK